MTAAQRDILLILADVYLRMGRPARAAMLLIPLARADPASVPLARLSLRVAVARADHPRAVELVERLVEREFSSEELAFALAMQSRALRGLGRAEAARAAWAECVALCRTAGLDAMEYAT